MCAAGWIVCFVSGKGVSMASSFQGRTARLLVVALLAAMAGGLAVEWWHSAPSAVAQIRDSRPMQLHVGSGLTGRDTYGIFLVDSESGRMAVYELRPNPKTEAKEIRLVAARYVAYDLRLDDYNNVDTTTPQKIRAMAEQQTSLENTTPQP